MVVTTPLRSGNRDDNARVLRLLADRAHDAGGLSTGLSISRIRLFSGHVKMGEEDLIVLERLGMGVAAVMRFQAE